MASESGLKGNSFFFYFKSKLGYSPLKIKKQANIITNYVKFVSILGTYSQTFYFLITDSKQVSWGKGEKELF